MINDVVEMLRATAHKFLLWALAHTEPTVETLQCVRGDALTMLAFSMYGIKRDTDAELRKKCNR